MKPSFKRISYVILTLVFVLGFTAPAIAGTQTLGNATDSSSDTTVPVTDHLMVTIPSNASQGGNDATSATVSITGTVALEDVAEVAVFYQALEVNRLTITGLTDQVISLPILSEILLSVINDLVCTDRAQHVQFPRAIYTSHFSPIVLGKLYCPSTNTSTCTINKNLLSALDISFSKKMQCLKSPNRNGGGFLECHIGRSYCQHSIFRHT